MNRDSLLVNRHSLLVNLNSLLVNRSSLLDIHGINRETKYTTLSEQFQN